MAELDTAAATGTRAQLAAIAFARRRMLANAIRTSRGSWELVAQIWVGFWFSMLGLGGLVGFAVLGWYGLSHQQNIFIMAALWALFGFWQLFPIATSAFGEHADPGNLLRFPLRYPAYVLIRVAFGAIEPATLIGGACVLGMVIGLGIAAPALIPLTATACLLYAAFNLLLSQTIFAWLERWLAKRRTREIMGLLFVLFFFSFNFIGPLVRNFHAGPQAGARVRAALLAMHWFAPGLPEMVAQGASSGAWAAALGGLAVLAGWAALTLWTLHLRLRREYAGENLSEGVAPVKRSRKLAAAVPARTAIAAGGGSELLDPAVAAVARKELRLLLRSPMLLFTLIIPVLFLFLIRAGAFTGGGRHHGGFGNVGAGAWGFPICSAYALLVLTNLIFNVFGTEGAGIQLYYLAPAGFRRIFLGKNITYGGILTAETILIYLVSALLGSVPSAWILALTLLGLLFLGLCDFACGNVVSLWLPKKIDFARMGRSGGRTVSGLVALGVQAVAAGFVAIAILAGVLFGHWVTLVILAVLAGAAGAGYWVSLVQAEPLALKRREVLITEVSKA